MNNYKIPPREMTPPVYAAEGLNGAFKDFAITLDKLRQSGIAADDYLGTVAALGSDKIGGFLPGYEPKTANSGRITMDTKPTTLSPEELKLSSQVMDYFTKPTNIVGAGLSYATGVPFLGLALDYAAKNSDEAKQKQAESAMRKSGINPLAEEYASVGDYGIDDTVVGTALSEALRNDVGDYGVSDYTAPPDVLGMVNQAAQASLNAKAAQQAAATYNDKDFDNALNTAIAEEIGTSVPATTAPASSVASTAATYNDKDSYSSSYSNDAGHNAPSGGYKGYSGDDVEASYSPSSDSGSSSGGK